MRVVSLLVLLLACAPAASAQGPLPPASVSVTIDPWQDHLPPGGDAIETPVRVHVSCVAERLTPPTLVALSITQRPAWAEVTITPESFTIGDPRMCDAGGIVFDAVLSARATTDAPAFMAELVEIEGHVGQSLSSESRGRGNVPIVAGFFSIVDVAAKRVPVAVSAEGQGSFELVVTNFGNANTRVDVELVPLAPGLLVEDVGPFVLQSTQAGGRTIAKTLRIDVERVDEAVAPLPLAVRWRSHYALDPELTGDAGELRVLVGEIESDARIEPAADAEDPVSRVPMPALPLVLSLALAVALALRRR